MENNKANYFAIALAEKKQLTTDFTQETLELIYHGEFASRQFRLYILQASLLLEEKANAIGQRYGRLNLRAKIKLHIDQQKSEHSCLNIVIWQGFQHIKD